MANHLMDINVGGRKYHINHSGETVYYSTSSKTAGTTSIKGLKFRKNQLIDTNTGKPVTSDFQISQKMGK